MKFEVKVERRDLIIANIKGIRKRLVIKFAFFGAFIFGLNDMLSSFYQVYINIYSNVINALIPAIFVFVIVFIPTFLLLLLLITFFTFVISILVILKASIYKRLPIKVKYEITENFVKSESPYVTSTYKWNAIQHVQKVNGYLLMNLLTGINVVIPTSSLLAAGKLEGILEIINNKNKLV